MAERYKNKKEESAESIISSLSLLNELKKDGAINAEEFEKLKTEILGKSDNNDDISADLNDFSKSLFTMEQPLKSNAIVSDSRRLSTQSSFPESNVKRFDRRYTANIEPIPIISEENTFFGQPSEEYNEGLTNVTQDIDFSLDLDGDDPVTSNAADGIDFNLNSEAIISDDTNVSCKKAEKRLSEIQKYFSKQINEYTKRDCALMDSEALSSLSCIPLFLVGAAAALFFFIILKSFADMTGSLSEFLIILCICAGIAPACVIIPNTVKIDRQNKAARKYNSILTEAYNSSGITDIPFEYTNPYIISALKDIIGSGRADNIPAAVDRLNEELSDTDNLAAEKKRADFAENDELAAKSSALYVLGKGLLNGI